MKATELCELLTSMIREHGDLEVRLGSMESMPEDIRTVEVWDRYKGGEEAPYFVL